MKTNDLRTTLLIIATTLLAVFLLGGWWVQRQAKMLREFKTELGSTETKYPRNPRSKPKVDSGHLPRSGKNPPPLELGMPEIDDDENGEVETLDWSADFADKADGTDRFDRRDHLELH